MTSETQVRVLMVLVAALVALQLLSRVGDGGAEALPGLVTQVHAQAAQTGTDIVFVPVGNQDVRKFVFWDRRTNQIHIYTGAGRFEETWNVTAFGQDLTKR